MAEYTWDDEDFRQANTKMSKWYKARLGKRDILRIIDKPYKIWVHDFTDGGFRRAGCSKDVSGKCPYCERASKLLDHKMKVQWATLVLHLTRQTVGNKTATPVCQVLAWRFGDDKKAQLIEVDEQSSKGIAKEEISVKVSGDEKENEQFQKLVIARAKGDVLKKLQKSMSSEIKNALATRDEIKLEIQPTYEHLAKFLKDEEEAEEFNPDDTNLGWESNVSGIGDDDESAQEELEEDILGSLIPE